MANETKLPHDHTAERAVLASVLVDAAQLDAVRTILEPADFHDTRHRGIFKAICELDDRDEGAIDIVTLIAHLQGDALQAVGGAAFLVDLFEGTARSTNAAGYARVVKERSLSRSLYRLSLRFEKESLEEPPMEVLEEVQKELLTLGASLEGGPVPIGEVVGRVFEAAQSQREGFPGIRTHFHELDDLMGGLRKSDLILIGARPGEGKTSLALNIALAAAADGSAILFFSLEMPLRQIATRLLFSRARVDAGPLQRPGRMSDGDIQRLRDTLPEVARMKIHVDDSNVTAVDIRARARQMKRDQQGLDLVIVDYLQLMQATRAGERRFDNRVLEIGEISRSLKLMAKDLDVPVLALSQLNRAPEQRDFARPQLADLRESGSLEQDADIVLLIHNPHRPRRTKSAEEEVSEPESPTRRIIVAKNRNGRTGEVELAWLGQFTLFDNIHATSDDLGTDDFPPDPGANGSGGDYPGFGEDTDF